LIVRGSYRERHADLWPTNYKLGMWVWLLHRVSGVGLALYAVLHIWAISSSRSGEAGSGFDRLMDFFYSPWGIALDLLLLAAVVYHTMNGVRILLFDLGIGVRSQARLFWGLMAVGIIVTP
jgi:succinate dehydrogenase / fumarate reductase cytochrome b subunit